MSGRYQSSRKQYEVTVAITKQVAVKVWAEDESDAEEKAVEIVSKWDGVDEAEVVEIEEI